MSTLGSDTVCATGSWLLSAPSSASSLPAAGNEEKMKGLGHKGMELKLWDGCGVFRSPRGRVMGWEP